MSNAEANTVAIDLGKMGVIDQIPDLGPADSERVLERLVCDSNPAIRETALQLGASILSDDCLTRFLRDDANDRLRSAGMAMIKKRRDRGVGLAEGLAKDRDPDVVLQAVLILDHFRDPRSLQTFLFLLRHNNLNVVQATITAIGNLGNESATAELLPFLEADLWVRIAAVQALGNLGSKDALDLLIAILDDPMVGDIAAESVARIGGGRAFEELAKLWLERKGQPDELLELLALVAEGLKAADQNGALYDLLGAKLAGGVYAASEAAARCLLAMGPGCHDAAAVDVMARQSKSTFPGCLSHRGDLIDFLLERDEIARAWGFQLAIRFPESAGCEALQVALEACDGSELTRVSADALACYHRPELAPAILNRYLRIPRGDRRGWGNVIQAYKAELQTAYQMRTDLDRETSLELGAILTQSANSVAANIVNMPAELRVGVIEHFLDRAEILKKLPWLEWLESDPRRYAAIAAEVADQAELELYLEELVALLKSDPSPELIRLVVSVGDRSVIPELTCLLEQGDAEIQPILLHTFGFLGGERVRQTLRHVIQSRDVNLRYAFKALARCATEEDLPVFIEAVADEDWYIRLTASEALSRLGSERDLPAIARLAADPVSVVANNARETLETQDKP
jgi:HEAT repeat protein